ncbi:MAG: putative CdaR family transcriptional regulator [Frankiales bacterium]|nr:putative CdaR family transcriptional regulator [Frankiales bacterium]MCW3013634.1 putative CdaR family transcriptional regulator [Solirubrobacterales bacterium]
MAGDGDSRVYREAIRAFADVAAALLETRERDELLRLVGRRLCELVGTPRCSVYLRDDATGLYRGQVGYADHDIDALVKRLTCGTEADGFTREIVETQAPVVIENAATDPRPVKSTVREWHIVSMMGVPMVLRGEVIGIVFLDAEDKAQKFTPLDRALASAFAELAAVAISQGKLYADLRESLDTVARQNQVLRRVSAVDDKLTGLILDGRNLREIAQAVTDLTHKPCAIHDADHRRLTWASPDSQDGPMRPRLLDADMLARPEIADALAALTPKKAAVVGPFPTAGLPYRFLVAPVTVRDDQWATLVLMEHGARLSGFDMLMSRRTATVIALELSAERRAANAEWNARASLAGELIRGNSDIAQLESRAQFVGMDLDQPHVLCLIGSRAQDDASVPDAHTAGDAFRAAAPHAGVIAAGVAEGVVVILEAPADVPALNGVEAVKDLVSAVSRELDPNGRLIAGLSTICRSPGDYVRAYGQARQVVQCLDTFHRAGSVDVLAADDLGAGRMFLANADADEAERFVEETLGGLLGDSVASDLLLTLSSFFDHGRSIRWSAVDLGVHENTVRYRLSRIEELTGLAVSGDSDAQLSAQLALLVLRLQGRLPRRDTPVARPPELPA